MGKTITLTLIAGFLCLSRAVGAERFTSTEAKTAQKTYDDAIKKSNAKHLAEATAAANSYDQLIEKHDDEFKKSAAAAKNEYLAALKALVAVVAGDVREVKRIVSEIERVEPLVLAPPGRRNGQAANRKRVQENQEITTIRTYQEAIYRRYQVYLSDLEEFDVKVGYDDFGKKGRLGGGGNKVIFARQYSPNGLGMHAVTNGRATARYELRGLFRTFKATVTINSYDGQFHQSKTPLTFRVLGDGRELWASQPIQTSSQSATCEVDIQGVNSLWLVVDCPGTNESGHSVWIEPCVLKDDRAKRQPGNERVAIPRGAVPWNGHHYLVVPEPMTWHVAEQKCEDEGGHLVRIESAAEQAFVEELLTQMGGKGGWYIDGSDELVDGRWVFSDGSLLQYANWGPNEPGNNAALEHAAVISANGEWNWQHGKWGDVDAGVRFGFICEWDE